MKFNLEDYEPVEVRIKKFLSEHPDGRIITEMITGLNQAIFKAMLYIGDILVSTGHAREVDGDGYVNKTSHIENCETSAIGRALANYGYHGNKRPSREEMEKVLEGEKKNSEPAKKPVKKKEPEKKPVEKQPDPMLEKLLTLPESIRNKIKQVGKKSVPDAHAYCERWQWDLNTIEDDLNYLIELLSENKQS